jgi:hypothetical protein
LAAYFLVKAPYLERAVQAENGMLEGLTWLLESDVEEEPTKRAKSDEHPGSFVPFTNEEFETKFMNV